MAVDHSVHRGPTLSTHLSIAYSANAAGSSPAAGSGVTASASGAASVSTSASGSPGNFLAALIDQLLAGAAAQTAASSAGAAGDGTTNATTTPTATVPNLLNLGIDAQATTAAGATPQGNVLLSMLTHQLQALQEQLAKGEQPDPDLLN